MNIEVDDDECVDLCNEYLMMSVLSCSESIVFDDECVVYDVRIEVNDECVM